MFQQEQLQHATGRQKVSGKRLVRNVTASNTQLAVFVVVVVVVAVLVGVELVAVVAAVVVVVVSSCPACEMFLRYHTVNDAVACAAAAPGSQTTVPDFLRAPLAFVLKSPLENPADVHGGAGVEAAVARTAASNLAAQAACDFAADAAADCEKAVAADASSADGGRWASGGVAAVHRGLN